MGPASLSWQEQRGTSLREVQDVRVRAGAVSTRMVEKNPMPASKCAAWTTSSLTLIPSLSSPSARTCREEAEDLLETLKMITKVDKCESVSPKHTHSGLSS